MLYSPAPCAAILCAQEVNHSNLAASQALAHLDDVANKAPRLVCRI